MFRSRGTSVAALITQNSGTVYLRIEHLLNVYNAYTLCSEARYYTSSEILSSGPLCTPTSDRRRRPPLQEEGGWGESGMQAYYKSITGGGRAEGRMLRNDSFVSGTPAGARSEQHGLIYKGDDSPRGTHIMYAVGDWDE